MQHVHIVAFSIIKHFARNNIFYSLQHGFREKRSFTTQLTMLVEDLLTSVHDKKQIDPILLDFSKAFDKVNHEKVLYKIHSLGVSGQTWRWIKSFLDEKTQSVVLPARCKV